jgi:UDP-GlcNAc:undecaprenyl-phosphate GlcNAc-1-phosphate transferase
MTVILGLVAGFLVARLLWLVSAGLFGSVVLQRPNHRGRYLPTGVGVLLAMAVAVVEGGRALAAAAGIGSVHGPGVARVLVLLAVFGFAGLGFVDDVLVLGGDAERGWRAHLRALAAGRLSAGGFKLVGGGCLSLALASASGSASLGRVVADGALVALAANLGNAFDRAPGRTIKVAVAAWVPLALVAGNGSVGVALAPAMGAALGLFPEDLGERLMLGDAGANALGAVLGIGAVLALGPDVRLVLVVVLAVLNLAAELTSFSRLIDRTPPLRRLDRLGRLP